MRTDAQGNPIDSKNKKSQIAILSNYTIHHKIGSPHEPQEIGQSEINVNFLIVAKDDESAPVRFVNGLKEFAMNWSRSEF